MLSRRHFITTTLAASFASPAFAQTTSGPTFPMLGHPGHLIKIRGKQLYVDVSGRDDAPPVVYIHGGPGAGSYDFGLFQRARLSGPLRLVQFDQRGCLRSEDVSANEPFTLEDLVEDTEALRIALGIERWSVICHSFAGLVALSYALKYPNAVEKVVFENPTFDIGASDRSMLKMLIEPLRQAGMSDEANEALTAGAKTLSARESWRTFGRLGARLGTHKRLDLYAPSLPHDYFFAWMRDSGLPQDMWLKGSGPSQLTLWADDHVFQDMQSDLSRLSVPSLLIKGRNDFNTGGDQMEQFAARARHGKTVVLEKSGHLAHAEEPDRFAKVTSDFLLNGNHSIFR